MRLQRSWKRHQRVVYGYLRARLLQPSDAEDLTQEVFLRCYSARARFDSSAMIGPWLIGIARNLLREHARKSKRRREVAWTELCLEAEQPSKPASETADERLSLLTGCLDSLGAAPASNPIALSRQVAAVGDRRPSGQERGSCQTVDVPRSPGVEIVLGAARGGRTMTDFELVKLLRDSLPEDLSIEQIEALRRRMPHCAELRRA